MDMQAGAASHTWSLPLAVAPTGYKQGDHFCKCGVSGSLRTAFEHQKGYTKVTLFLKINIQVIKFAKFKT